MELVHTLLLQAIEGESAAETRYEAFAGKALAEGFAQVAALFAALSKAEAIHIANHVRALEKNGYSGSLPKDAADCEAGSTKSNLEIAITAEYEEFKTMYPSFRKQISKRFGKEFNAKIALLSMRWAHESEANHHRLLEAALHSINAGSDVRGGDYYLCTVCGNIHFSKSAPDRPCEVCGHDSSFYTMMRTSNDGI